MEIISVLSIQREWWLPKRDGVGKHKIQQYKVVRVLVLVISFSVNFKDNDHRFIYKRNEKYIECGNFFII